MPDSDRAEKSDRPGITAHTEQIRVGGCRSPTWWGGDGPYGFFDRPKGAHHRDPGAQQCSSAGGSATSLAEPTGEVVDPISRTAFWHPGCRWPPSRRNGAMAGRRTSRPRHRILVRTLIGGLSNVNRFHLVGTTSPSGRSGRVVRPPGGLPRPGEGSASHRSDRTHYRRSRRHLGALLLQVLRGGRHRTRGSGRSNPQPRLRVGASQCLDSPTG
jgi:hypothetical protein